MNHATIIDTPLWYKILQHSDYNPTLSKQKLRTKPRRAHRSSWSRRGNQKSFTLTILLNHCTSTPHRPETNGIAERALRRVKEGTSAVLLQLGLDNEWWADSTECDCYLRNIQDLLSVGKTPYERRFGMPFNGPVIPFWSNCRISSYFCEGHIAITSIWSKSLAWYIPWICVARGENLEMRLSDHCEAPLNFFFFFVEFFNNILIFDCSVGFPRNIPIMS